MSIREAAGQGAREALAELESRRRIADLPCGAVMKKLIEHLEALANLHGATLKHPLSLTPMSIECYAKHGDFSRGVLATIVEVCRLASQTTEGRQAIHDLGFRPFFESAQD